MSFDEHIMFEDNYPSMFFTPKGTGCVYYPSHNFYSFENWGISWDIPQF